MRQPKTLGLEKLIYHVPTFPPTILPPLPSTVLVKTPGNLAFCGGRDLLKVPLIFFLIVYLTCVRPHNDGKAIFER